MRLYKSLWMIGLLAQVACGPKTPTVKNVSDLPNLKVPEFEAQSVSLGLQNPTTPSESYEGSILLWNPEANPNDIATVIKESAVIKALEASCKPLEFQDDLLWKPYKTALDKKEELERKLSTPAEITTPDAGTFFGKQSVWLIKTSQDAVEKTLTTPEQIQAFETFCEAALIRFASDGFLLEHEFSSRPTPLGICEGVYSRKGFFTDPQCLNPNPGVGNYIGCFWGDTGVLKTSVTFYRKPDKGQPGESNLLSAVDKETYVRSAFRGADWPSLLKSNQEEVKKGALKIPNYDKLVLMRFKKTLIGKLLTQTDWNEQGLPIEALWRKAEDHIDFSINNRLHNIHKILGQTPPSDAALTDSLEQLAVSAPSIYGTSSKATLELDSAYKEAQDRAEQKRLELQKELDVATNQFELIRKERLEIHSKKAKPCNSYNEAKGSIAGTLKSSSAALSLWPSMDLKILKKDELLVVSLRLDETSAYSRRASGCVSLGEPLTEVQRSACRHPDDLSLGVAVDEETGKLTITFNPSKTESLTEDFGAKFAAKNEKNSFNLISDEVMGRQESLVITLYPRLYKGLELFSGSAKFMAKGVTTFEGTASFSRKILREKSAP